MNDKMNSSMTLSQNITEQLSRRIIDGIYTKGTRLPNERTLAEELGVTRNIVREALKRMEAIGLVTIRHGSGALVEDVKQSGGLGISDLILRSSDGSINHDFFLDVVELHQIIHIGATRLAAQHISDEEIDVMEALVNQRRELSPNDPEFTAISLKLSRVIVDATRNQYWVLLVNTLIRASEVSRGIFFEWTTSGVTEEQVFFERLLEAFKEHYHQMAEQLTARIFEELK